MHKECCVFTTIMIFSTVIFSWKSTFPSKYQYCNAITLLYYITKWHNLNTRSASKSVVLQVVKCYFYEMLLQNILWYGFLDHPFCSFFSVFVKRRSLHHNQVRPYIVLRLLWDSFVTTKKANTSVINQLSVTSLKKKQH